MGPLQHVSVICILLLIAVTGQDAVDPLSDAQSDAQSDVQPSSSCAYSASGVIATPLHSCSVYAQSATTGMAYSYQYDFDAINNALTCSYYNDLHCDALETSYWMDDDMMAAHNIHALVEGSGSNCDTVSITKHGSYSPLSDECSRDEATDGDYFSMSYVLNECISSDEEEEGFSAVLLCDEEKIYFNYYAECTHCGCAMEQYIYKYFGGNSNDDDCWDIECNAATDPMASQHVRFGAAASSITRSVEGADFIKHLLNANTPWSRRGVKELDFLDSSMPLFWPRLSLWMYCAIGAAIFVLFCGLCRYINGYDSVPATKDYKEYEEISDLLMPSSPCTVS